jgi:hypothetical protein
MSHDPPLRWRSVFLGAVVLLLVLLTCYLGSYFWWMRHTKSGRVFDEDFSRHENVRVREAFSTFYRPARRLEKQWGFVRYRKLLLGAWASDSGDVTMEVRKDLTVEITGLAPHGLRDRIVFSATDPTSPALVLMSEPGGPGLMLFPLPASNKVGVQMMLHRVNDPNKWPTMVLARSGSLDEKSKRITP